MESETWKKLKNASDETEAAIIRGVLEAAGVKCMVEDMRVSQIPLTIGKYGDVLVFVREDDFERAEQVLLEAGHTGQDWG